MAACPDCGGPLVAVKVRRCLRVVEEEERQVRVALVRCLACPARWLLPVVEIPLPPERTTLRYLAPDERLSRRDTKR